jgi:hypothetical protein
MNTDPLLAWARFLAARFSAPVLLVGSALYTDNPRDVDIRVVMDGEHFDARFGGGWYDAPPQLWVRDMAKLSRDIAVELGMNIDLQVVPDYRLPQHAGKPRRILAVP